MKSSLFTLMAAATSGMDAWNYRRGAKSKPLKKGRTKLQKIKRQIVRKSRRKNRKC